MSCGRRCIRKLFCRRRSQVPEDLCAPLAWHSFFYFQELSPQPEWVAGNEHRRTRIQAYDATKISTELWHSARGTGNAAGNAVKFTVPTVGNGKVYIGTRGNHTGGTTGSTMIPGEPDVYGLLPN